MAEGGHGDCSTPRKKIKYSLPEIGSDKRNALKVAFDALKCSRSYSFCLLKIERSNADLCKCFSQAFCLIKRSCESDVTDRQKIYPFSDIFQRGMKVLQSYIDDQNFVPDIATDRVALQKLLSVLQNISDVSKSMSAEVHGHKTKRNETSWTVRLAHHLLSPLAVHHEYVIDDQSKFRVYTCPCCNEIITGEYGDNSLGNREVWHGSLDILMGKNVGMKVTEEYEQLDASSSSFEIKDHPDLRDAREQIIAETIVFGFLQKQVNSGFDNFLIPTIGISKEDVLFYLYDPDHDILLESPPFNLFLKGPGKPCLSYAAVLALWLTINYPYFCTGITNLMKERGFTADFFSHLGDDTRIRPIYETGLQLGECRGRIVKTQGYYLPRDGELWEVEKGGVPVKEK